MANQREVVITGLGVVSPIGVGRASFWQSIQEGRSGIKAVTELQGTPFPILFGGEIAEFDGKQYVTPRKSLKLMCREIQTGYAAATLAIQDANLVTQGVDRDRFGVVYGCEMMFGSPGEMVELYHNCTVDGQFDISRWGQRMTSDLFPLWMLKYLPNMAACHVAIAHDAHGPNNSLALGDVSGLQAIQEAARYIERGIADVVIAGGTGTRINISTLLFRTNINLAQWEGDPTTACRPFEAERRGIVNGEGAGALVLEAAEHAAARGAQPLARVLGCGNAFEAVTSVIRPGSGRAVRQSIRAALQEAQRSPSELGFVSANGLATVHDDIMEAQAIRDELADVPVWAPKSYFGHLGAGTAAVESVAAVCGLVAGQIPGTLNYDVPDPRCPVNVARNQRPMNAEATAALVLSQAPTGQAASLLLGRP